MKQRCKWCLGNPLYEEYHDKEWGVPVHDDRLLFEFLILESAQAGLSWLTILKKRDAYRKAFDNFDPQKVAQYSQEKEQKLLANVDIVRNRLKIKAAIQNAKVFLEIQKEYSSFDKYIWSFVEYVPVQSKVEDEKQVPAKTELSDKISKDLKKRGMNFVGSTIIYAFMQAVGMVNDHTISCFRCKEVQ